MSLLTGGLGGPSGGLLTSGLGVSSSGIPGEPGGATGGTFFVAGGAGGGSGLVTGGLGSPYGLMTGGLGFAGSGGAGEGEYVETPIGPTLIWAAIEGVDTNLTEMAEGLASWVPIGGGLWNLDGHTTWLIAQVGGDNTTELPAGTEIWVTINDYEVWRGRIATVVPQFSEKGWIKVYTAYSPEWWAGRNPVTDPASGMGRMTFNVNYQTDPEYREDRALLTVGEIALYMLQSHEAALTAAGVTGWVDADYDSMTVIPPVPITFNGMNIFVQIRDFINQWAGDHAFTILADGTVRARKWLDFADVPYDMALDGRTLRPAITRDSAGVYGAVVVRGMANIQAATLLLSEGDLEEAWDPADEPPWKLDDTAGSGVALDVGVVTASTFLTVTIDPDDNAKTWAADELVAAKAMITLKKPLGAGGGTIDLYRYKYIVGNTALGPGGTSVLTLDSPLETDTGWTEYRMNGRKVQSPVYRDYTVVAPEIGEHLIGFSPKPIPISTASGTISVDSYTSRAWVIRGVTEFPMDIQVLPDQSKIRFYQPVVTPFNSADRMRTGNPGLVEPDDINAALFFADGTLEAREPESGFEGTGFTEDGMEAVYYHDIPDWSYEGDTEVHRRLARMMLETMKDILKEGSMGYEGLREDMVIGGPFLNVNIVATGPGGWTTGLEGARLGVRSMSISYEEGTAMPLRSEFTVSNRKRFATAPQSFVTFQAASFLAGGGFVQGGPGLFGDFGGHYGQGDAIISMGPNPAQLRNDMLTGRISPQEYAEAMAAQAPADPPAQFGGGIMDAGFGGFGLGNFPTPPPPRGAVGRGSAATMDEPFGVGGAPGGSPFGVGQGSAATMDEPAGVAEEPAGPRRGTRNPNLRPADEEPFQSAAYRRRRADEELLRQFDIDPSDPASGQ